MRQPRIPPALTRRPISLDEARAAGLTRHNLRGKAWRRLGAKLYCWIGVPEDPWLSLAAWQRLLPAEAVFAGATAGWLHGLALCPNDPVEIAAPASSGIRTRDGLNVRRYDVSRTEIKSVRGLRATALHRTLLDLCGRLTAVETLVAIDAAIARGLTNTAALKRYASAAKGRAGTRRLRNLATIAAPAESPMETRLRWLLIQHGLARPEVQAELRDGDGRCVGRADLYYPSARLVIEYDGTNHRARLIEDNRRQNLLLSAGFNLLRFTAADFYERPIALVAQVKNALS